MVTLFQRSLRVSWRNIAKRHISDQREQAEKLFPFKPLNLSSFSTYAAKIDLKHELPE